MANPQAEGYQKVAETAPCTIRSFSLEDLKQISEIEREAFPKTGYPKEVILNYAKRLRADSSWWRPVIKLWGT